MMKLWQCILYTITAITPIIYFIKDNIIGGNKETFRTNLAFSSLGTILIIFSWSVYIYCFCKKKSD